MDPQFLLDQEHQHDQSVSSVGLTIEVRTPILRDDA
jgi:hypothetical protein